MMDNPVHFSSSPRAQPICGVNEFMRIPGEPPRFINSTDEPGKVECFQCLRALATTKEQS